MKRSFDVGRARTALAAGMLIAAGICPGSAAAQQSYSSVVCRAGTVIPLAKAEGMVSFAIDHRGIVLPHEDNSGFANHTQRCVGSVAIIRGVSKGSGYCRNVDPETGDLILVEWNSNGKPGTGTFRYVYGTGKWKGISGGGEYQPVATTRAVDGGTYQNCIKTQGSYTVP
jgi:hypothetical protein